MHTAVFAAALFAADLSAQPPGFRFRAELDDGGCEWKWVRVPVARRRVIFVGEYLLPERRPAPPVWMPPAEPRERIRLRASLPGRRALLPWNRGRTDLQADIERGGGWGGGYQRLMPMPSGYGYGGGGFSGARGGAP
jgi:hypothetical protein